MHRPGTLLMVGNWDRHKRPPGNGFGVFGFDARTGALLPLSSDLPDITVGAVCHDRSRDILYCTDEYTTLPGNYQGGGGQVYALAIDRAAGRLSQLGRSPSFGSLPSGLALDAAGRHLVVTHHTDRVPATCIVRDGQGSFAIDLVYDDATTVLFPLDGRGAIGAPRDVFWHQGTGGPLPRQTHPQLHSVTAAPSGAWFLVCDKGNDELVSLAINGESGGLRVLATHRSPRGSSPRYVAFHPRLPCVFVNHETQAIVSALRCDDAGQLQLIGTVAALPAGIAGAGDARQSDIVVHPSGRHLYSLVRGMNAVACFAIDERSGAIERTDLVQLDGTGPRGCAISPDGRFLVIAALDSREVLVWLIDAQGRLAPTGIRMDQPNPGTVTFA